MKNTARWGIWIVTAAALLVPLASCARGGSDRMAMDSGVIPPGLDGGTAQDTGMTGPTDTGVGPRDTGVVTDTGVGGSCSETPCRLLPPQCGCPAGQGCYLTGGTERTCATQGPEREGQACSGVTACQAGLLCAGSAGAAFCSRFCNSDADCTGGPGSICIIELSDGMGGSIPGVRLCSAQCVPPTANGCPTGMACSIFGESDGAMRTFTGCTPAGTAPTGASCVDSEDCSPGHFCGDPGTGNECIRLCTVSTGGPECGAFEACNSFSDPAIIGGTEYGFCF
ncbi:MAG: hypothetical protein RLO52_41875 [Sandaracinaceae bacterium]